MENRALFDLVGVYIKAERRINEDTEGRVTIFGALLHKSHPDITSQLRILGTVEVETCSNCDPLL